MKRCLLILMMFDRRMRNVSTLISEGIYNPIRFTVVIQKNYNNTYFRVCGLLLQAKDVLS